MIPAPLNPPQPPRPDSYSYPVTIGAGAGESLQWVDQFSEEMLLTVQAFQRLHAALQNRMLGK